MDQSKLVISDEQRYQFNFLAKKPGSNIFQQEYICLNSSWL